MIGHVHAVDELPEIEGVGTSLLPGLEKQLEENGFKLLYLSDLTYAYWFSTSPIKIPSDLRNKKFFTSRKISR